MDRFAKSISLALMPLIALMGITLAACENSPGTPPHEPRLYRTPPPLAPPNADTPPPEEKPIEVAGCESIALPAYPNFTSITSVFPDPHELLTTPDTSGALARLRAIASPTQDYHAELLRIVDSAGSLDKDHLVMLARAVYFTAVDAERIQNDLTGSISPSDASSCLKKAVAGRDHQVLVAYSVFSDSLLASGLRRIPSLSWEEAQEVLNEVLPTEGGSPVFFGAFDRLTMITEDVLLDLVELASRKRAFDAAGTFALSWFRGFSERDLLALLMLNDKLSDRGKDVFLLGSLNDFRFFTIDEVLALSTAGFEQNGTIAGRAFLKIDVFSDERVKAVAAKLDDRNRGDFLSLVIRQYRRIASAELTELLNLTSHRRGEIALLGVEKLTDATPENIVSVASLLSGPSRDEYIERTTQGLATLTTEQLTALVKITYKGGPLIAESLVSRISDFGMKTVVGVGSALKGSAKDEWLRFSIPLLEQVTTAQTVELMKQAYIEGFSVAQNLLPKITDLSFSNILKINRELHGTEKDKWIGLTLSTLTTVTTAQVAQLLDAVYTNRIATALACLDRISDFNAGAVALISAKMYGAERTHWLQNTLPRLAVMSTFEAIEIIKTVQSNRGIIAVELARRVTDLTSANAVAIAKELKSTEKDLFLLEAVELITDLSSAALELLAQNAFNEGVKIRAKGEVRLSLGALI